MRGGKSSAHTYEQSSEAGIEIRQSTEVALQFTALRVD